MSRLQIVEIELDRNKFRGHDGRREDEPTRMREKQSVNEISDFFSSQLFLWTRQIDETESNSVLDHQGVDMVLYVSEDFATLLGIDHLLIQVKSSHAQVKTFLREHDTVSLGMIVLNGQANKEENIKAFFDQLIKLLPRSRRENFARFFWTLNQDAVFEIVTKALEGQLDCFVQAEDVNWAPNRQVKNKRKRERKEKQAQVMRSDL